MPQLVRRGRVDFLVFDYLAELTMSILAAARMKDPAKGYATDFVDITMKSMLREIKEAGIRVVSNAGGINPRGCAEAISAIAQSQNVPVRIAIIEGDDVMPLIPELRGSVRELQSGEALPEKVATANAYLGAIPIAKALAESADIVITGRCVDSAVTLGVLMHEFGWSPEDYDKLAQGSLAGHIIECGCQATGGLHTDWDAVPGWDDIGYPIIECRADGSFQVTKPEGTGGLMTPPVIAEQILYEVADPASYILPDVICDFSNVRVVPSGTDRVAVSGAKGRVPTTTYKVSATYFDGYKCSAQLTVIGFDAAKKLERTADAILTRTRRIFREMNLPDYTETNIEILGSESLYGPHARAEGLREGVLRLTVTHPDRAALEIFAREISPAGTSWAPGTTGFSGRPQPSRLIKQFAFLLPKTKLPPVVLIDGKRIAVEVPSGNDSQKPVSPPHTVASAPDGGDTVDVELLQVAYGRSGDKGDTCNIAIVARNAELLPILREQVTEAKVAEYLKHLVLGDVKRFDAPGLNALNFVCERALGG
ncbi:MAG: acyclic terpene utilization AtuA family protein, partial [Pseudorhodoplanes sp.]